MFAEGVLVFGPKVVSAGQRPKSAILAISHLDLIFDWRRRKSETSPGAHFDKGAVWGAEHPRGS